MEKYSFKCLPEEFDLERIARENNKDGNLAFLVIDISNIIVGVSDYVEDFNNYTYYEKIHGYTFYLFNKELANCMISEITDLINKFKETKKVSYKVLTWK